MGAYDRLDPRIQKWIWEQGWDRLRAIQEAAFDIVVSGENDVILSSPTASGKTEAAILPIASALLRPHEKQTRRDRAIDFSPFDGFSLVMVFPLKALINDQQNRLKEFFEPLGIAVTAWHGDVRAHVKRAIVEQPSGVLLITPESLEAMFMRDGLDKRRLFANVRYLVIDEFHAFLGQERGIQVMSLAHRLECIVRRRIPRIALSATLSEPEELKVYLRPEAPSRVVCVDESGPGQQVLLALHAYSGSNDEPVQECVAPSERLIPEMFDALSGHTNLLFANSRTNVEILTDVLVDRGRELHRRDDFVPHHGNLANAVRQDAEVKLKRSQGPVTAICTSTLELGIDIGAVHSIVQFGPPSNVSSLRQRLGRSGRRGEPSILRTYLNLSNRPALSSHLFLDLVQSIAVFELMLERWYEPPSGRGFHVSTMIQQILSAICQYGGLKPEEAFGVICPDSPFQSVSVDLFARVLRDLGPSGSDMLMQDKQGRMLLSPKGERLCAHYSFYAAFEDVPELTVYGDGRTLGTIPDGDWIRPGRLMNFAGRRWRVNSVDRKRLRLDLNATSEAGIPIFVPAKPLVDDGVRARMKVVLEGDQTPIYCDESALTLLNLSKERYAQLDPERSGVFEYDGAAYFLPWRGDLVTESVAAVLRGQVTSVENLGAEIRAQGVGRTELLAAIRSCARSPKLSATEVAGWVVDKRQDKHDWMLSEETLNIVFAARNLDIDSAYTTIHRSLTP